MYRDEILDKSLASLSNEAQEILRKCELLNYDRIIHLDDVGSIMCNDPDFVRNFESVVIDRFPQKDRIKLRRLLIKNGCYSKNTSDEKTITKIELTVTAGTFRPIGYLQPVNEEYLIDRIQGKIHVKNLNNAGNIIKKISVDVPDSKMNTFFFLANSRFCNGIDLGDKASLDGPRHDIVVTYSDNTSIDDWGYDIRVDELIECIKKILICSI